MSRTAALLTLNVASLACAAAGASAQDWRTVTSMRQYAGEKELEVNVEYGAGELRIEPATGRTLYRAVLRYDGEHFRPVTKYREGILKVGIEGQGRLRNLPRNNRARLDLTLGTEVPMTVDLAFGAVEADIELGGLRLRNVEISTGASETRVRFSRPNPERCRLIDLEAGAAAFRVEGLGNANAEEVRFDGGVGDIVLDFTGEWRGDMTADIDMGVGALTLRIPRGLGVKLQKDTFLTSFDPEGMIKRGNTYFSENWERATHKLTLTIDAAFGSIDVRWVDNVTSSI